MSKVQCQRCGIEKSKSDFYEKTDKKSGRLRLDRTCMECRRQQRKLKYRKEYADAGMSKRIIEPRRKTKLIEKRVVAEEDARIRHAKKLDFNDIEETYGKKITYNEKCEMVQRFNEFVTILREGYSAITGENVFIRKD